MRFFHGRLYNFLIAPSDRDLFTADLYIRGGERIYLIPCYYKRTVSAEEIVSGQQLFYLPQLKFGKNGLAVREYADVLFQAFDIEYLVQVHLHFFLAYIKEEMWSVRRLHNRRYPHFRYRRLTQLVHRH